METEVNIAETLREIAANSDSTTGKILKKCNKAASKGLSLIRYSISKEDYASISDHLNPNLPHSDPPPYFEKLLSLGFTLWVEYNNDLWGNHKLVISW